MTQYSAALGVIVSALILGGCSAPNTAMKPNSAASGTVAHGPACLPQTGTRIAKTEPNSSEPGRCYGTDEIRNTGASNAGDALRLLDPSIVVHQ